MEELRKCPFCGGEVKMFFVGQIGHLAQCEKCKNMTPWKDTEGEAIAAWNRRATQNIGKKECSVQGEEQEG